MQSQHCDRQGSKITQPGLKRELTKYEQYERKSVHELTRPEKHIFRAKSLQADRKSQSDNVNDKSGARD
jgi:hypothetical protein